MSKIKDLQYASPFLSKCGIVNIGRQQNTKLFTIAYTQVVTTQKEQNAEVQAMAEGPYS